MVAEARLISAAAGQLACAGRAPSVLARVGRPARRRESNVRPMLLGVDVGGTFTDAVLAFDGRLVTAKAPTTPDDQSEGVIAAIEAALDKAGRGRRARSRSSRTG